jgi:hypothetical protein
LSFLWNWSGCYVFTKKLKLHPWRLSYVDLYRQAWIIILSMC